MVPGIHNPTCGEGQKTGPLLVGSEPKTLGLPTDGSMPFHAHDRLTKPRAGLEDLRTLHRIAQAFENHPLSNVLGEAVSESSDQLPRSCAGGNTRRGINGLADSCIKISWKSIT